MEKSFDNLIGCLRDTFVAEESTVTPASRILVHLNKWRREGEDNARAGGSVGDRFSCEDFLHRRILRAMQSTLPKDRGADNGKALRIAATVVRTTVAGAAKLGEGVAATSPRAQVL